MRKHPINDKYAATESGDIISSVRKKEKQLKKLDFENRRKVNVGGKLVTTSRFIWECFNGIIPENYVIYHKDNNYLNDNINNLGIRTKSEHQSAVMHRRWNSKG